MRPIRVMCSGRVEPDLVLKALREGADGVLITGCRTGDCFDRYGNVWMDERFQGERIPMFRARADRERIVVARGAETDGRKVERALGEFRLRVRKLNDDRLDAGANEHVEN